MDLLGRVVIHRFEEDAEGAQQLAVDVVLVLPLGALPMSTGPIPFQPERWVSASSGGIVSQTPNMSRVSRP